MTAAASAEITELLIDWSNGDQSALDRLFPLVERELKLRAHHYLRRQKPNHTLQTTAVVNEAYLKLVNQKKTKWQNRAHFFAIAATIMRRVLINYVRDQDRQKRWGKANQVSLSEAAAISTEKGAELIALDEALKALALIHPRKSQVVEMRYFGGLTVQEISEVLQISQITVNRDWKFAKAWLIREIGNT